MVRSYVSDLLRLDVYRDTALPIQRSVGRFAHKIRGIAKRMST
jgi:hypothetical protein